LRGNIDAVSRDRISGWAYQAAELSCRQTLLRGTEPGEMFRATAYMYCPAPGRAGARDETYDVSISLPEEYGSAMGPAGLKSKSLTPSTL
jgi:hypothetical protein